MPRSRWLNSWWKFRNVWSTSYANSLKNIAKSREPDSLRLSNEVILLMVKNNVCQTDGVIWYQNVYFLIALNCYKAFKEAASSSLVTQTKKHWKHYVLNVFSTLFTLLCNFWEFVTQFAITALLNFIVGVHKRRFMSIIMRILVRLAVIKWRFCVNIPKAFWKIFLLYQMWYQCLRSLLRIWIYSK